MDNVKIRVIKELEDAVHQCGARLMFLPPYSPELNPIKVCIGQLKCWIQKHENLVFPLYPELVLDAVMPVCTKDIEQGALRLFGHCGYDAEELRQNFLKVYKTPTMMNTKSTKLKLKLKVYSLN
eukprot:8796663-Ditylum_brightwellii.AAC.1